MRLSLWISMAVSVCVLLNNFLGEAERWKGFVAGDGVGYYVYLPAVFIYHDPDFSFTDSISTKYREYNYIGNCGFCNLDNGERVNKYFCGEAVALAPFYILGDITTQIAGTDRDGFSKWYLFFVGVGAIFYLWLGLFSVSRTLLRLGVSEVSAGITVLILYLGTNLFYYTSYSPSMTHVYSFSFISVFFLQILKLKERSSAVHWITAAVALGMIVIIRPVNILCILAIPFLLGDPASLRNFLTNALKKRWTVFVALAAFGAVVFIQLLLYKVQTGKWFVYAYGKEGFDFTQPHILEALFSYNGGMFVYSPVLMFLFGGLFFLFRRQTFRLYTFFLFLIPAVWVISSWWVWNYAGTYGMRPMIEYYAVFACLIGFFLDEIFRKRIVLYSSLVVMSFLVFLVQLQTWQFNRGMIGWDGMTSEMYWKVFCRTGRQFEHIAVPGEKVIIPKGARVVFETVIDFEDRVDGMDWRSVLDTMSFSGQKAMYCGDVECHPPVWKYQLGDFLPDSILQKGALYFQVKANCWLENDASNSMMISAFSNESGIFSYHERFLIHDIREEEVWVPFIHTIAAPSNLKGTDHFEFYITRRDTRELFYDDLSLVVWQW